MFAAKNPPEEEMNPIHQNSDGLWYFWDETQSNESIGYATYQECEAALVLYVQELEGELAEDW